MFTGAVLAGGRSRRFGKNKALERYRGKRLIDLSLDSLKAHCDPLFVVANDLELYYDVGAHLVQDVILHQGPLGAVYTALLFSPHDWVMIKATDMPFLETALLEMILDLRTGVQLVVPVYDEQYEPLLALYHRSCLPAIGRQLAGSERKVVSFYRKMKLRVVEEKEWRAVDPEGRSFWNINTMEDLEKLQWN